LPTGEVLPLGSRGSPSGWFTADGPGPSLRGIVRGFQGTMGGMGVFTKCAVKLYRWDGPAKWEIQGETPEYVLKKIPPNISFNVLAFPCADAMKNAGYRLGEAGIDYAQFRTPMFMTALGMTEDNRALKTAFESGIFQKTMAYVLCNAVVGRSRNEYKWKMAAMKEVLRETGGVIIPMNIRVTPKILSLLGPVVRHIKDPLKPLRLFPLLQDIVRKLPLGRKERKIRESRLFWLFVRNAVNTQATFRPSQGLFTTQGSFDTWDLGVAQSEWIAGEKKSAATKGLILDDGGDMGCGGTFEGGHLGYLEGIGLYSPKNPESVLEAGRLVDAGVQASIDKAFGVPIAGYGSEMHARFGPECRNYHGYMSKIKEALDPNLASDPYFYTQPDADRKGGDLILP